MVSIQFQITFILFDTKIPLLRFYTFKSELLYNTNANYNFARLHATKGARKRSQMISDTDCAPFENNNKTFWRENSNHSY